MRSFPHPRASATAVFAIIAIAVSGCASPGKADKPATLSARQAIKLAMSNVATWRSDISTTTVSGTDGSARISFAWTLREESGFNESTVTTYTRDGKDVLPGGSDAVVTPTADYMNLPALSAYYHTSKPWVELSPATMFTISPKVHSPSPPGTFWGDPILTAQLLTTSTDVLAAGTGSVNGVPVTEYAGTYAAAGAIAYFTAIYGTALSARVSTQVKAMGLTSVQFRTWLDAHQRLLKAVLIEAGTHVNVTVTQIVLSINQPANIQFPQASQTYVVPGS